MTERPNILLIMADQFRTASLTGMGDGIETPNIDRIRAQSVFFPKAACTAPLCTPSRASLATGKYPRNCGVQVHDADLPLDQKTYYQALTKAGYRVAVVGKTDLHKKNRFIGKKGDLPVIHHLGFTDPMETEGKVNCSRLILDERDALRPLGPYQAHLLEKDPQSLRRLNEAYLKYIRGQIPMYYCWTSDLPEEDFLDAFIGRMACRYLQDVDDDCPWHLFASFSGPHNPWDPPKEAVERVRPLSLTLPPRDTLKGKPEWVKRRASAESLGLTESQLLDTKRHYAASISVIDKYVGKMMDILEQRGLMKNTVVVFTADHGEMMGEHGLFEKKAMYEGALRIPLMIHTPGMAKLRTSGALASLMDLAPTFLELGQAAYDPGDLDALSLCPILSGETDRLRDVQQSELLNTMMLCDGRYKWIRSFNDRDELYDLQEDPEELHNCISQHSDVIERLQAYTFHQ